MKTVSDKMSKDWANAFVITAKAGADVAYPSETLVRLIKGDYITGRRENLNGKSVLDVGFGNGNNIVLFASLGMKASGVEIHQAMCDQVLKSFDKLGIKADLRFGTNQKLPFKDNTFDYLVSWNVLHYEGSEKGIKAGIKEYARVLKPGGRLLLSTTGPTHNILKNSKTLGNHRYKIGKPGDFRAGQIHFFFDAPNYIQLYFSPHFNGLKIGRIEDYLFRDKLDWWLVTGIK